MTTALANTHILIADDHPDTAATLGELLEMCCPAPITTAIGYDGMQAVAIAVAQHPTVVILDLDMPVMNGFEAASAIRAELSPVPCLIAITGNPFRTAKDAALFDHMVVKPIDIDLLVALVSAACNRRSALEHVPGAHTAE